MSKFCVVIFFFVGIVSAADKDLYPKPNHPLSVTVPPDGNSPTIKPLQPQDSPPESSSSSEHRMSFSTSGSSNSSTAPSPTNSSKPASATAATVAVFSPAEKEGYKAIIERCNAQIAQQKETHQKEKQIYEAEIARLKAELTLKRPKLATIKKPGVGPLQHSRQSSVFSVSSASSPSEDPATPFAFASLDKNSPPLDKESPPPSPETQDTPPRGSPSFGKESPQTPGVLATVAEEFDEILWV